ncbi:flagellar hook protein FlgE [Selenomonas ruminantium]|uniref:Flagellar hook protein FlgE n=1 Tax=Selenomonas ruminantium TaxID=971 RepID=A0A1I0X3T3_SELRU|nr:flagellar hook-basal body complex protein [Selenomonas ruminantium]SFA94713.1 flagellar hook protein FlgE [Selenomonas ruminantium]
MMRSLFSGVSGLKGHQTRMDVIGNNIANVNATGFKSSRVTFADTLSQTQTGASAPGDTVGGTNPKQIGLGTGVASIDLLFTDASVQSTGKNTDVALSGNGLFVVKSGSDTFYTRDGAFEFDADGNYVLPGSGHYVQGWMATDGTLNTTGAVENIVVKAGKSMAAKASSTVTYENNLNSAALTITAVSGGTKQVLSSSANKITLAAPLASLQVTAGTLPNNDTSSTYTISSISGGTTAGTTVTASTDNPVVIKLSLDGSTYTLVATGGTYTTTDVTVGTTTTQYASGGKVSSATTGSTANPVTLTMSDGTSQTLASGSYTVGASIPVTTTANVYDTLGNAHTVLVYFTKTDVSSANGNTWTVSLTPDTSSDATTAIIEEDDGSVTVLNMEPISTRFTTSGKYDSAHNESSKAILTLSNGSQQTQNIALDLTALTQYSGNNTVKGSADGNAAGTLKSVSIDTSGIITGVYTNGVRQSEAQIAIAQFTNASGLTKTGSSLYQESNNSGTANIKTAADLGVTITPSALEMSNVDIANEFSDMIITQRGFQSNSKIITVGDEMLETLINMKR